MTTTPTRKPEDYTASYRCPFGHQNQLHLMMERNEEDRITEFRGSGWDYCRTCNHGPNTVQRMQFAMNIYRQWLAAGVIDLDEYHRLANAAVTQHPRKHRGPVEEVLSKFSELMMMIEVRAKYNNAVKNPGVRRRFLELRRDLSHMKVNFQQWAIREKLMEDPRS